jgi:hypothetical protein
MESITCQIVGNSKSHYSAASETDLLFIWLGLENVVMFKWDTPSQFNAENYSISVLSSDIGRANVTISIFDEVVTED